MYNRDHKEKGTATMEKITEENLNNLSKEQLVTMVMDIQKQVSILEERIAVMNVNTYGRKTEKLIEDPDQIRFFNEVEAVQDETDYDDGEPEESEETETIAYTRKKKQKGKRETDLSRFEHVQIMHELSEEELTEEFGEGGWKRLPDQIYTKLEVEPAKYWVAEHHIAVYAGKKDDHIRKAEHPAELLNNSIASASVVAGIMNGKYTNLMPLYRIAKEFENHDVCISKQNMANWVIRCSERYLSLVYNRLQELLKKEHVIQADETPAYISKDGKPAGSKSEMWVFRSGEYNRTHPVILYHYDPSRASSVPDKFLKGFEGYLETDAFSGYHKLEQDNEKIVGCLCWAHARRSFANAVKAYGKMKAGVQDTLAYRALEKISDIYRADEKLKIFSPAERKKRRQTVVKRRVDAYFAWAKEHVNDTGKQDETHNGFAYSVANETSLRRFLEDGEIPIDNSACERIIRPFTVARKTWKLIDTPSGADASAVIYSLVETAKANNLKVYDYLKYLLEELPKHMDDKCSDFNSFLDSLLPWSDSLPVGCKKKNR